MAVSRALASLVAAPALRGLPPDASRALLDHPGARRALLVRFAYIFTFHAPVVTPLLEVLSGSVHLRWAVYAIGLGSLTMMLAEVPAGLYADRAGPRRALRRGLVLMCAAMLGFFLLGVLRIRALEAVPPGHDWWPGVIGILVLEVVVGVALSLISGADTVYFIGALRRARVPGLEAETIEAVGSALRYLGTMVAVGIGAVLYGLTLTGLASSTGTRILAQGGLFLLTLVALLVAVGLLGGRDRGSDRDASAAVPSRRPATWGELGRAAVAVFRRPAMFAHLWTYAWTLGASLLAVYVFQSQIVSDVRGAVREPAVLVVALAAALTAGFWASAEGSLLFRGQASRGRAKLTRARHPARASILALFALTVYPLTLAGTRALGIATAWPAAVAAVAALLAANLGRGFFEPLARTALWRFADERGLPVPTSLISVLNMVQRFGHFLQCLVFSLLVPSMAAAGAGDVPAADRAARTSLTAHALLLTAVVVAILVVAGIVAARLAARRREGAGRRCVVVGSYRDRFEELVRFCDRLRELGHDVLHPPADMAALDCDAGFVRTTVDPSRDEGVIQKRVFALIDRADRLIVFNPDGRIGTSAALEIGYALSRGIPVATVTEPEDRTLARLTGRLDEAGPPSGEGGRS